MWRTLDTILERTQPDVDDEGNPEHATLAGDPNEVGDEVWYSDQPQPDGENTAAQVSDGLAAAKNEIGPGECTFSHLGDELNSTRVCKDEDGNFVPPPMGHLFYPTGVAVYKDRVYVADRMNHRVQVVDFHGTPLPITRPIGNGEPGTGLYTTLYPGHSQGHRLKSPTGLATDSAGRVLVADGGNARIAIFDGTTGAPAFGALSSGTHKTIEAPMPGVPSVPAAVAVSPGVAVVQPNTTPANQDARVVVIDRDACLITAYDLGFNLKWKYPASKPAGSLPNANCFEPNSPEALPAGRFSIMTGAAIDASHRIYVVDAFSNRIQVFTKDGVLLGVFGAPVDEANPEIDALETPSSVLIDHNGRVVVNDSDNLRLAFYDVTFESGPPVAKFLFEVPTKGDDHEGFQTGLAEQWGTVEEGLDPAGRYLKIDTAAHRLQRLELADLAIVQASAKNGEGFFNVAVPMEKANFVDDVTANVVPGYLDDDGNLVPNPYAGVAVTLIEDIAPGTPAADDIYPGRWVKYRFTYTDPNELPEIKFVVTAKGNESTPQPTEAPPVVVTVRGDCEDCDAAIVVHPESAPDTVAPTTTTPTGAWYREVVFARLTPSGVNAAQVTHIEWFVTGSDLLRHGPGIKRTPLPAGQRFVDVMFAGKNSTITFWAVGPENTVGPEHSQVIRVDRDAPVTTFNFYTPDLASPLTEPSGFNPVDPATGLPTTWWNTDVAFTFANVDDASGVDVTSGASVVTGQGRDLSTPVTAVDRVGHSGTTFSNHPDRSGVTVNIDRVGPVITPPASLLLVAGTSGVATVPASFATAGTAADAISGVKGAVSGTGPATVAYGQTVTWTFAATDWAGNTTTATATVSAAASALIYTGAPGVEYGRDLPVSANLEPTDAQGQIRFTMIDPVRGNRVQLSSALVDGVATAIIPAVLNNVGAYDMLVEYVGTDLPPTSTTTRVTVTPTPISVIPTPGQGKKYGVTTDPVLTYVTNYPRAHPDYPLLHPDDVIAGQLGRAPGEAVGSYRINLGTFAINNNYTIHLTEEYFRIVRAVVNIAAGNVFRTYGVANPASFDVTITGDAVTTPLNFTVTTTAVTNSNAGTYPITVNPGSNPSYEVTTTTGTLTVRPRPVNVKADDLLKLVNTPDPALTYTVEGPTPDTGLINGASISGTLTRAPGEFVGEFAITNTGATPLTVGANYTMNLTPGILTIVSNLPGNDPPVANDDTVIAASVIDINVLVNDSDPNGDALTVTAVDQPATGGTVSIVNNKVRFVPASGFTGTTSFIYTVSDGKGGTATATVTVTITAAACTIGGFTTYTQGGWGGTPNGNNPAQLLANRFSSVYPSGFVRIGGNVALTFTSAAAIRNFLPAGGTARVLTSSAVNPRSSSAGVFAGQVLALQLNVDFSRAGVTKPGLGELLYQGYTVSQWLDAANQVLGGNTAALSQLGLTIAQLNAIVDSFNNNFDNGTSNDGVLTCPSGSTN